MNYKFLSLLSGDNLKELIKKCNLLVDAPDFREMVVKCSNCSAEEVDNAFKTEIKKPTDLADLTKSLGKVYQGLLASLPKREYSRVQDSGFLEDPKADEGFKF